MRRSFGFYWIQRLEIAREKAPEQRPFWYSLRMYIMVHHASPEIKPMLKRPWAQVWKTDTPKPPLSVHHFLRMWKTNNTYIPPKTLADLASMEFWFHPALNRYTDNSPTMGYKKRTYCDGIAVPPSRSSLF
jgi:hypothetical protein